MRDELHTMRRTLSFSVSEPGTVSSTTVICTALRAAHSDGVCGTPPRMAAKRDALGLLATLCRPPAVCLARQRVLH
jgi:hypothetical protein